jgi:hypothetical protein
MRTRCFDNLMSEGHRVGRRSANRAAAVLHRRRRKMAGSPQRKTDTFPPSHQIKSHPWWLSSVAIGISTRRHLRLHVILDADLLNQIDLGFQPIDMIFLTFENILE